MLFLVNNEIGLIIFCFVMLTILQYIVLKLYILVVVQLLSHFRFFVTPWTAAHQASLSLTISWSLPKFMFIALVMPSSHLIFWCPLLLPSIFPSIRDFSKELSLLIRWPKYWSFSVSSSSEYSGLISLKIDWFDLLAAQGTLRSLLLRHSSKILRCSAFFMAQLSQLVHDHWEDHSLDYMDICRQSNICL